MARRGLPLRPTLVTGVTALIFVAAGAVGVSAFLSSRRAVASLWKKASSETAHRVTQRTLRFLEPAAPYVALTQQLAEMGRIDPSDRLGTLDYFRAALQANPSFTWASYGGADGAYFAAYRNTQGGIEATLREQVPAAPGPDGGAPSAAHTRWREFVPDVKGGWTPSKDVTEPYDPRTRGWYRAAVEQKRGVWVEPFLFQSRRQPGFIYAFPHTHNGDLRGVWAVEFEVSALSSFLATQKVGEHGKVYVISRSGLVVGHPDGQVTEQRGGTTEIARAATHPDAMLSQAWAELNARGGAPRSFAVGKLLVMAEPFPAESGIDWVSLGVAPQQDFFGEARAQAFYALLIGALVAVLASLLGALLASRVSDGMYAIGDEMDRIGRFEFTEKRFEPSLVREVNAMSEATDRMKNSLRSFGKYVPTELVRDLLRSGEEAKLGGHKQQLTTLFSDVEGFTTFSEQMDPDKLVDALGEYFSSMSEEIRRCGGTVDKYIGDAIMAFWGAPRAQEDHALNACRAALAMTARLGQLQEAWAKAGKPAFRARIGINTGQSLVGNIGSPSRMNYTAMGDAVNLASRLEGLNKSYGTRIVIGESTAAEVKDQMVLRPLDFVAVKGRAGAILVHELLGETGKVDARTLAAVEVHREALGLYRARRFAEAAARFDQVSVALGAADEPSLRLAARCRQYAAVPPPGDWNGSHVMMAK